MDIVVIRRFDDNGLEYFAVTYQGITLCSFTPNVVKVQQVLAETFRNNNLPKSSKIGFFDALSNEMKSLEVSALIR